MTMMMMMMMMIIIIIIMNDIAQWCHQERVSKPTVLISPNFTQNHPELANTPSLLIMAFLFNSWTTWFLFLLLLCHQKVPCVVVLWFYLVSGKIGGGHTAWAPKARRTKSNRPKVKHKGKLLALQAWPGRHFGFKCSTSFIWMLVICPLPIHGAPQY